MKLSNWAVSAKKQRLEFMFQTLKVFSSISCLFSVEGKKYKDLSEVKKLVTKRSVAYT